VRNREEERRGFVYFLTKKRKIKTTACRGGGFVPPHQCKERVASL